MQTDEIAVRFVPTEYGARDMAIELEVARNEAMLDRPVNPYQPTAAYPDLFTALFGFPF